jgi:hypothetical protein
LASSGRNLFEINRKTGQFYKSAVEPYQMLAKRGNMMSEEHGSGGGRLKSTQDFGAGLFLIAIGLFALWQGWHLPMGACPICVICTVIID